MHVTTYGESRYLKAYLAFRCGDRKGAPSAASYKLTPGRAGLVRNYVDALLNGYYHNRRTRKRRVIHCPSDQEG
jgi:hypothetical protein